MDNAFVSKNRIVANDQYTKFRVTLLQRVDCVTILYGNSFRLPYFKNRSIFLFTTQNTFFYMLNGIVG